MANDLDIKKDYIIKKSIDNDLSSVVKPLIKEIYLFSTLLSGTTNIDENILKDLKEQDDLILIREINKFDELAIKVTTKNGLKIGYIPEEDNSIFSRLMDAGKILSAKIDKINKKDKYYQIHIHIYLVDV